MEPQKTVSAENNGGREPLKKVWSTPRLTLYGTVVDKTQGYIPR